MADSNYIEELEREYQNKVVKLFREKLGYAYLGNLQYAKGATKNSKGETNSPIIESELRAYLESSGKYTKMQVNGAVHRLKEKCRIADSKFDTLRITNNIVYEQLLTGVAVKPDFALKEKDVMYFDFYFINKNRFAIAEEVSYIDPLTGCHSRPDIVVYVNGIALCVIELKRSFVSLDEAIKQHLSNEKDLIPSFFTTTQFTVAARHAEHKEIKNGEHISEGLYGFKYATIGTDERFWCPWKKDTNETGIVLSDTECFKQFFDKKNFLFLFHYGVLSDGGIKKVMRPHQFYALRAAVPRLKEKASGVIWHSQGSGKSLTMVWLASYIRQNFEDPRVLVITDRTELDAQLSREFTKAGNDLHRTTSQADLLSTLQNGTEWLICTLIHKFGNHATFGSDDAEGKGRRIPLDKYLNELKSEIKKNYPNGFSVKGKNIFIFIDECHRTQGGLLHEAMRAIMGQDVMLIGFTGTPLLKEEKKNDYAAFHNMSVLKFGPYIHTYLHKQAVEDKVILDLQYEAREVEQNITSKEKLDEKLEEITKGLTDERKELVKDRWATLERVYSSKERIERIAYSILDDMENNSILRQDWANAMLVAGNIYSAYKYYDFFQNKFPHTCLHNRVAVVTSYEPSDYDLRKKASTANKDSEEKYKHDIALQSFKDAGVDNADQYEEWAKERFVKWPGLMKLIIVVDKLLTGFDAPCATFLYIDKDMRDHNLFQAICRVNRLGVNLKNEKGDQIISHKEFGLIVDFKNLFAQIDNAIHKFNDEEGGFGNFEGVDIEGLLTDYITKYKQRLLAANKAYNALKAVWQSKELTNPDLVIDYYITDFPNDPAPARREVLYKITGELVAAYDNIADFMFRAGFTTEEAECYEKNAKEASHINLSVKQKSGDAFDIHYYDPDMRDLLDRYLRANDAEVIVEASADFSFLDRINDDSDDDEIIFRTMKRAKNSEKAAAEIIEAKARAVINNSKDSDPTLYKKFSERLQLLLNALHSANATFAEQMKQLIQLIKEAKRGGAHFPPGIVTKIEKALWNNRAECGFSDNAEKATSQIRKVQSMVIEDAPPGYRDPTSADSELFRMALQEELSHLTDEQLSYLYDLLKNN